MNKLFKLVIVNLLGIFDMNKIIIARLEGVKSNLEKKTVLTVIMALFYGYFIYKIFTYVKIEDYFLLLNFSFLISSFICFFIDLFLIEPVIFKNKDNAILFAMPLKNSQILFSKLFTIYLRNLLVVGIVMGAALFSYLSLQQIIDDTFGVMYSLSCLVVPLLPIVLSTTLVYLYDYLKIKNNKNILFRIGRILVVILVLLGSFMILKDIKISCIEDFFRLFVSGGNKIYFLGYLFKDSLIHGSLLSFLLLVIISIGMIYFYSLFVSNNYNYVCSILKGINKKSQFVYSRKKNLHRVFGVVRKEMISLFHHRVYLLHSYEYLVLFSLVLLLGLPMIKWEQFYMIPDLHMDFNLYIPILLSVFVTIRGSAISAMSLEKKNIQVLFSMPISIYKIIVGKWLTNVLLGSIFVLINGTLVWVYLDLAYWSIIFSYLLPFVSLLFVSLFSLILDYRFIEKVETDESVIIKQRFLVMIPSFCALLIGVGPFLYLGNQYIYFLGSYIFVFIVGIMGLFLYLNVMKRELEENLLKS